MDYGEALEYIHSLRWLGKKAGLSKTKELLGLMGNPEDGLRFVHVAGTNGKGSISAMTAGILKEAGYKTGLFTSPYIVRFNERMSVNGKDISDEELADITGYVKSKIDMMEEPPSEFEVVTAIGMEYFRRHKCDIIVLEVGMGGEFDSTNVIRCAEADVIATIDYDHRQYLGDTIEEIAAAKAGIIKKNAEVVFYGENETAEKVIRQKCEEMNAALIMPEFSKIVEKKADIKSLVFDYKNYKNIEIKLHGLYQMKNCAVVLEIIGILNRKGYKIDEQAVYEGLKKTSWPVRFEIVSEEPCVVVDGGHNRQGIDALTESFQRYFPDRRIICVFGVMADKDIKEMLEKLLGNVDTFIAVEPVYPRAMKAEELYDLAVCIKKDSADIRVNNIQKIKSVSEGIYNALTNAGKNDVIYIGGSLYLASEALEALQMQKCH